MKNVKYGKVIRLLALTAAFILAMTLLPDMTGQDAAQAAEKIWGKVKGNDVHFRKQAGREYDAWCVLPNGWILEWTDMVRNSKNEDWYKVKGNIPGHLGNTYIGFIRSDYFTPLSEEEADAWESYPVQVGCTPTPAPKVDSNYAVTVADSVRVREYVPDGTVRTVLKTDTLVEILSRPSGNTANDWYFIRYNDLTGYVNAPLLKVLTVEELEKRGATATPVPGVTPTPYNPPISDDYDGYCRLRADQVHFRKTPNGNVITTLPQNTVFPYKGTGTRGSDGYIWFNVMYSGQMGYIRSDMLTFLDERGNPTAQPTSSVIVTPTPVPTAVPATGQYMKLTAGGVNYRVVPDGTILGRLNKGTIVPFFGTDDSGKWALVYSDTYGFGYISTQYCYLCDASGNKVTPTVAPVTPTPTPSDKVIGYVATSVSSVNLRSSNSTDASVRKQLAKNTVTEQMGSPLPDAKGTNYIWYPVRTLDGTYGYLRSDCAYSLADWQVEYYRSTGKLATPTPAPTGTPTTSCPWYMVTGNNVNVRSSSSTTSTAIGKVNAGQVFKKVSSTKVSGYLWIRLQYTTSTTGYIRSDLLHQMTWEEYYAWSGGKTTPTPTYVPGPTGTQPITTPSVTSNVGSDLSDMAFCTGSGVNIREDAGIGFRSVGTVYTKNSRMTYLFSSKKGSDGDTWYYMQYGTVIGWMSGKYCKIYTNRQKTAYLQTGNADAKPEASYTTLSLGSTGNAVTVLQKELVYQGYLAESQVNGQYLSTTVAAVKAFQQANGGLVTDGVAGTDTQHALFKTVPVGTYESGTVVPDLQPVEYSDWNTGIIQSVWPRDEIAIITYAKPDAQGHYLSYKAKRWAGGEHADVEPLTAADTAVMCRIYNVDKAQTIKELNLYQRYPIWVTVGGHTFAASMYGVPHNYPEGDTIPDNEFSGQFCVHFTNSRIHGDKLSDRVVDANHQAAIKYAYEHSISGNK